MEISEYQRLALKTLNPDLDYMVYTKDGETLIQGVGEYAGSIVLGDGE